MTTLQIVLVAGGATLAVLAALVLGYALRLRGMLRRPIPLPTSGRARLTPDVPLGPGSSRAMDLYAPAEPQGRPPLVVFVPGDGPEWMLKNARKWGIFQSYGQLAADRGFVAAVIDHRSSGNYKDAAGLMADVEAALATLRGMADQVGFDPERIAVWTFSGSGGPVLARLLAVPHAGVGALLSMYGFFDLEAYTLRVPSEVVAEYSLPAVLQGLDEVPLPVYVLHAGRDRKLMTRSFERVVEVVRDRGLSLTTRVYPEGKHGFEVLSPADEVREEIERAFRFVEDSLAGAVSPS